jgi:hypothetical protein
MSKAEKVKIFRLIFEGTDSKVTAFNVDAVPCQYAVGAATGMPMVAKQENLPRRWRMPVSHKQ